MADRYEQEFVPPQSGDALGIDDAVRDACLAAVVAVMVHTDMPNYRLAIRARRPRSAASAKMPT
jgi:hypothetical protein